MFQYMRQAIAVAVLLLLAATIPHIFSSIFTSHQVKAAADHSIDSAFIPKLPQKELEAKVEQLTDRINSLKKGSSCLGSDDKVCQHLKEEYQKLLADADIAYQMEVNKCLMFETKWNTTCQAWKADSQKLLAVTIDQSQELKNNSAKIQNMANLISQLRSQIRNTPPCPICQQCTEKPCPICPEGEDIECPPVEPCPQCEDNCAVCQKCQECPHCYDEDYNQLRAQYTNLYRRFEECEGLVEDYHNKPQDSSDCRSIQDDVKQKLRNGINSLSQLLRKASLGSQNLRLAITRAEQGLTTSRSLQESLSVVPSVLNSLAEQLEDLANKSNQSDGEGEVCQKCGQTHTRILDECMSSFKRAVDKLKICEKQLSPFLFGNKQ